MVRWPHRSPKGITPQSTGSEISTRARGSEARLRPLLFVLVFSVLAGRGGESGSLTSGSSRLLSSAMDVHMGHREDTNSWDAGPERGLEKGMVNVDGFEIPKHATGWGRVRAMAESSWKRGEQTVGPGPKPLKSYIILRWSSMSPTVHSPACTATPHAPPYILDSPRTRWGGRPGCLLASADGLVCRRVRS